MQRLDGAGLLGTFAPSTRPAVNLAALVVRAREAHPDPRPVTRSATLQPRPPAMRAPLESRPAGAQLGRVVAGGPLDGNARSLPGILGRLNAGDPLVIAALRRDPVTLRRLLLTVDRVLGAL